jgi:hypothetical protein
MFLHFIASFPSSIFYYVLFPFFLTFLIYSFFLHRFLVRMFLFHVTALPFPLLPSPYLHNSDILLTFLLIRNKRIAGSVQIKIPQVYRYLSTRPPINDPETLSALQITAQQHTAIYFLTRSFCN